MTASGEPYPAGLDAARRQLSNFVMSVAERRAQDLGFGWKPTDYAPDNFRRLTTAFLRSRLTGDPLPVYGGHSDDTIFVSREVNLANRFWHDTNHLLWGERFDLEGESVVASRQLEVLRAAGYSARSLEHRLFHADLFGQLICHVTIDRFPTSQFRFVVRCIMLGVDRAIARELTDDLSDVNGQPGGEAA